ncbi:serine/threonine-protein kinase Chk1-like [Oratosquilla oratoria]|uniref:serine/threonine-protein kinase Chk1-like n=1 Tax=Oratosquilla oratoria TaxID=337810 RepID=UPI003F76430F
MFFLRLLCCCCRPEEDLEELRRRNVHRPLKKASVPAPDIAPEGPVHLVPPPRVVRRSEDFFDNRTSMMDWRPVKVLGVGGFGIVELAQNRKTEEFMAIKRARGEFSLSYPGEEIIHSQLKHKNIVELFFWKWHQGDLVLCMEYCPGALFGVKVFSLQEEETKKYFDQLMEGVRYLHSRGVVHRDLRPENLILGDNDLLKICDFGCSCAYIIDGVEVALCGVVGTSPYMAPEIFEVEAYRGPPVDLWSCGILLFNMVTSAMPWYCAYTEDIDYSSWLKRDPETISSKNWNKIKKSSWNTLLFRLLAKEPSLRLLSG